MFKVFKKANVYKEIRNWAWEFSLLYSKVDLLL